MPTRGHCMHRILSSLPQIAELKSRLGDSEAQRETLQAEMGSLQSRHSAEVTSLQSQCSAMQAKCAGLQDQGRSSIDILNGPGPGTTSVLRKRQVWAFLTNPNMTWAWARLWARFWGEKIVY